MFKITNGDGRGVTEYSGEEITIECPSDAVIRLVLPHFTYVCTARAVGKALDNDRNNDFARKVIEAAEKLTTLAHEEMLG
jgi:hypothetical protein